MVDYLYSKNDNLYLLSMVSYKKKKRKNYHNDVYSYTLLFDALCLVLSGYLLPGIDSLPATGSKPPPSGQVVQSGADIPMLTELGNTCPLSVIIFMNVITFIIEYPY